MLAIEVPHPPLTDGAIVLRGFESSDVPTLVAACQDPEISRFTLVPRPYGEDDARAYLQRVSEGREAGTRASFAIVPQAVAARAGFEPIAAPLVQRPECDHLPDVFFARLRGD